MQTSKRTTASLGLVGVAVVTGVAVSGGVGSPTSPAGRPFEAPAASTSASRPTEQSAAAATQAAGPAPAQTPAAGVGPASLPRAAGHAAAEHGPDPVLVVLDASRSMRLPGSDDSSRLESARRAVERVVGSAPQGTPVGVRVFGSAVPVGDPLRPGPAACQDSHRLLPVAPVDRADVGAVVASLSPRGYSPVSRGLEGAAHDLGTGRAGTVVLVSDGVDSCTADPARTVTRMRRANPGLRVSAIGLRDDAATVRQLRAVAAAGGGTYAPAAAAPVLRSGVLHPTAAPATDDAVRPAATGAPADPGGNGPSTGSRHSDQRHTAGAGAARPAGFVSAFLLLLLFLWLKDHK